MQSLQQKASEWSGVDPNDAFAIDETNLFEKLGLQTFINLSTNFYNRKQAAQRVDRAARLVKKGDGTKVGGFKRYYCNDAMKQTLYLHEVRVKSAYTLLSTDSTLRDFTGVYDDEEEWFRSIFSNSSKEDAIRNQYEFFVQRMGGRPLYSERKGHPALIGRHRPFPVTHKAAERWLQHMQQALNSITDIDEDSKIKMMNFFRHTAFFLVAGDELKNQNQGVPCKHAANKPAAE